MPELPEVETVRRSLEPAIAGQTIVGLEVGRFAGVLEGMSISQAVSYLSGRRIRGIRRRGKYLMIDLDPDGCVVIHLRMTGNLVHLPGDAAPLRFQHLSLLLGDGSSLRFADQRKFGRVIIMPSGPDAYLAARLGPEPLSRTFTAAWFAEHLAKRSAAIKAVLLDQKLIAGIGNIYADEALFQSRIHPLRPANSLSGREVASLHRAIRAVLRSAIDRRGTSFSTFLDGYGEPGENQEFLSVYGRGRTNHPCPRCGRPLQTTTIAGRTSHFCPRCQRPPGAPARRSRASA